MVTGYEGLGEEKGSRDTSNCSSLDLLYYILRLSVATVSKGTAGGGGTNCTGGAIPFPYNTKTEAMPA